MSAIEHPELHNLDQIDERLRRAVVNARTMHGIEGLKRFDAETYEHALQLARSIIKESREARAEAIYWTENVMGNITRLRDAALDAEADALRVECGGIFSWGDIGKGAQNDWRAVALKAREMHRRKASLDDCAWVYRHSVGTPRDCLRAVLQHLGVEVTP